MQNGLKTEKIKHLTGYLFQVQGTTISWASKKQDFVALSSTEAEHITLAEASKEAMWLKKLLRDYRVDQLRLIRILEDNQGCFKILKNKKFSNRKKHISTKFHYARGLREKGLLEYQYYPPEFMVTCRYSNLDKREFPQVSIHRCPASLLFGNQ